MIIISIISINEVAGKNMDRVSKLLSGLSGADKILKSAIPRAASTLRTESAKAVKEKYAISTSNIRTNQNVNIQYSIGSGVSCTVTFAGTKIPLFRYDGSSPKSPTVNQNTVAKAIVNGWWRKVYPGIAASGHQLKATSPVKFENAFVARMASGHTGIFERTGGATASGSDEIKELMGSSVPQMLGSKEVSEQLAKKAAEKLEERVEHEMLRILNGW